MPFASSSLQRLEVLDLEADAIEHAGARRRLH
jgi:hypothetical protein